MILLMLLSKKNVMNVLQHHGCSLTTVLESAVVRAEIPAIGSPHVT